MPARNRQCGFGKQPAPKFPAQRIDSAAGLPSIERFFHRWRSAARSSTRQELRQERVARFAQGWDSRSFGKNRRSETHAIDDWNVDHEEFARSRNPPNQIAMRPFGWPSLAVERLKTTQAAWVPSGDVASSDFPDWQIVGPVRIEVNNIRGSRLHCSPGRVSRP